MIFFFMNLNLAEFNLILLLNSLIGNINKILAKF